MDAIDCILTRRSSGRLVEPAPGGRDLDTMLGAAMAAPDHGLLRPWRFVVLRGHALERHGSRTRTPRRSSAPAASLCARR